MHTDTKRNCGALSAASRAVGAPSAAGAATSITLTTPNPNRLRNDMDFLPWPVVGRVSIPFPRRPQRVLAAGDREHDPEDAVRQSCNRNSSRSMPAKNPVEAAFRPVTRQVSWCVPRVSVTAP